MFGICQKCQRIDYADTLIERHPNHDDDEGWANYDDNKAWECREQCCQQSDQMRYNSLMLYNDYLHNMKQTRKFRGTVNKHIDWLTRYYKMRGSPEFEERLDNLLGR